MHTREKVSSKEWLCLSTHLNYTAGAGKSMKGGRGVTAIQILSSVVLLQFQFLLIPALSSNAPKAGALFAYWLAKTGKTGSDKIDAKAVSYILNLCSATMPNIELFCFILMVRIWLLPALIAGARREELFRFLACFKAGATGNLTAEQNPLLFVFIYVLSFQ